MSEKIDDYIQQGIHGVREINPDERRRFLGTLRERIVVVLTKEQVREKGIYKEVELLMKKNINATLYLNGHMNYTYLSDYIKLANKVGMKYILSTNKEYNSEYGLVLAHQYAVNNEEITVSKKKQEVQQDEKTNKRGIKQLLKKLF